MWSTLDAERKRAVIAEFAHASAAAKAPPALLAIASADEAAHAEASMHVGTFLQSLEDLAHPLFTGMGRV